MKNEKTQKVSSFEDKKCIIAKIIFFYEYIATGFKAKKTVKFQKSNMSKILLERMVSAYALFKQ
jgi:hypothetical protein